MSAIDQITTLMETMTFAEKLSLNERIATAIRKEGGKAGSKKAKADGEAKPKRKAAAGTLAWTAYVKHIKVTQPDAFDGITKESDKLQIVKGIRAGDAAGYDTFVTEWKANYAASQADAEAEVEAEVEVVAAPAPKASPVTAAMTPAQKIAALKAAKAAAPAPAPAKKEVKKAKAAPAKKAAKEAVKEEDIQQLPVLTIGDQEYWHDEDTHGLWNKTTDRMTAESTNDDTWVGYYQPGNDDEPIREAPFGDE